MVIWMCEFDKLDKTVAYCISDTDQLLMFYLAHTIYTLYIYIYILYIYIYIDVIGLDEALSQFYNV